MVVSWAAAGIQNHDCTVGARDPAEAFALRWRDTWQHEWNLAFRSFMAGLVVFMAASVMTTYSQFWFTWPVGYTTSGLGIAFGLWFTFYGYQRWGSAAEVGLPCLDGILPPPVVPPKRSEYFRRALHGRSSQRAGVSLVIQGVARVAPSNPPLDARSSASASRSVANTGI